MGNEVIIYYVLNTVTQLTFEQTVAGTFKYDITNSKKSFVEQQMDAWYKAGAEDLKSVGRYTVDVAFDSSITFPTILLLGLTSGSSGEQKNNLMKARYAMLTHFSTEIVARSLGPGVLSALNGYDDTVIFEKYPYLFREYDKIFKKYLKESRLLGYDFIRKDLYYGEYSQYQYGVSFKIGRDSLKYRRSSIIGIDYQYRHGIGSGCTS